MVGQAQGHSRLETQSFHPLYRLVRDDRGGIEDDCLRAPEDTNVAHDASLADCGGCARRQTCRDECYGILHVCQHELLGGGVVLGVT